MEIKDGEAEIWWNCKLSRYLHLQPGAVISLWRTILAKMSSNSLVFWSISYQTTIVTVSDPKFNNIDSYGMGSRSDIFMIISIEDIERGD